MMRFVLRSDSKIYDKLLGISQVTVLAFCIVGMFSRFIPSQSYHFYASIISIPVAVCIAYLTGQHLRKRNKNLGKPQKADWFSYPVFGLLWLYLSYMALTLGVPSIFNHVLGSKHEQIVTVSKKTKGGFRGLCRYRIHTKELTSVLSSGLCTSQKFHD